MLSLLQFCLLIEVVPVILIYMLFVIFRWSNDNLWMKEKKTTVDAKIFILNKMPRVTQNLISLRNSMLKTCITFDSQI